MSKALLVIGFIAFFLFLSIMLGYAGVQYIGMENYNVETGQTPELPNNLIDAFLSGGSFIFGAMFFTIPNIPIWLNLICWLPILGLIIIVIEIVRGV